MQWNSPIVSGTDRDHTKVYDKERHCYNCEHFSSDCSTSGVESNKFEFKEAYPPERQSVYWGRILASVCKNFLLKGKGWDQ